MFMASSWSCHLTSTIPTILQNLQHALPLFFFSGWEDYVLGALVLGSFAEHQLLHPRFLSTVLQGKFKLMQISG